MESGRSLPLTPRRKLNTSTSFEPTLNEFLKMDINFDKIEQNSTKKCDFSPKKTMTIRERSISTAREYQSDKIQDSRRRAFDVSFQRKARNAKVQLEKEWSENERMREWRTKCQHKEMYHPKRKKTQDSHVIEHIIQDRNSYYLASQRNEDLPQRPTNAHTRALPREVRATSIISSRTTKF